MPALATFEGRAYALPEVDPDWGLGVILRGNPEGRLEAPFGVPAEAMHGVLRCLAEGERAPVVRTWDGCPPESCLGDVFAAAMYLTQLRWACRVGVEPPAAAPWGVRKACEDANRLLGTWLSALTGFGGGQAVWADTPLPLALVFTGQPGVKFRRRASVNRAVYVPQLQRYATVCPDPVLGAAALSAASRGLIERVCEALVVPGCAFCTVECDTVCPVTNALFSDTVFPACVVGGGGCCGEKKPSPDGPEGHSERHGHAVEGGLRPDGARDRHPAPAAGERVPGGR